MKRLLPVMVLVKDSSVAIMRGISTNKVLEAEDR